jgi:hypothetical protein
MNKLLLVTAAAILCGISCGKDGKRDAAVGNGQTPATTENSIFKQDIFAGISSNLDDYYYRKDFTVKEVIIPSEEREKNSPEHYMIAENDDLIIAFWPDIWDGSYKLQFIDIKKKSGSYFLGQFIGMTVEEIINEFSRPADYVERPKGRNYIVYSNTTDHSFINFWLEDNIVIRAAFAYPQ